MQTSNKTRLSCRCRSLFNLFSMRRLIFLVLSAFTLLDSDFSAEEIIITLQNQDSTIVVMKINFNENSVILVF